MSCFSSTANRPVRNCLLPHCLGFRLTVVLLFGAFAKDTPLVHLGFTQLPASFSYPALASSPHSCQSPQFLLASKIIQTYPIHIFSASQSHPIHFFSTALFHISFLFAQTLTAIFQLAPPASLVCPAFTHPPQLQSYLFKTHIYVTIFLSSIKSYQCYSITSRVKSEFLSTWLLTLWDLAPANIHVFMALHLSSHSGSWHWAIPTSLLQVSQVYLVLSSLCTSTHASPSV